MSENQERTWLIKHSDFTFSRPISETELLDRLKNGELMPRDEICQANGYWFSLQDIKEMRLHFGNVQLEGLQKNTDNDVTQERNDKTASIVVPAPVVAKKPAPPPTTPTPVTLQPVVIPMEEPTKTPLTQKVFLLILILVMVALLFVWFG